ncbi:MAG: secretin N-terminal domain-containing protein, partial [Phycisphaerae bacterium]
DVDPFVRLGVEHLEPAMAIELLTSALGGDPEVAAVRFSAGQGAVLVFGARPAMLDKIKAILEEMDRPRPVEQRIFTIRHATPGDIKTALESFLGGRAGVAAGGRQRGRPAGKGPQAVTAVGRPLIVHEIGDRLIVQTTAETMVEVAELIEELDVEDGQTKLRVYADFPPGADIDAIADTLANVFSGSPIARARGGKKTVRGRSADRPRFIPRPETGTLVVIAAPHMFSDVEELLEVLRAGRDPDTNTTEYINVTHADPGELVELITPLLEVKSHDLVAMGLLRGVSATRDGKRKVTPRRSAEPGGTFDHFHISADHRNRRIVVAAPSVLLDEARKLVAAFDLPDKEKALFRTVDLVNADPKEMVRSLKEMMGAQRRARKAKAVAGKALKSFDTSRLSVVEAPGDRAVILHGPSRDVETAMGWIKQLDAISSRGRAIRVFSIKHADLTKLAELILNVVDTPAQGAAKRRPVPARAKSGEDEWELSKTWVGQSLYIQGDLVTGTMIVAAPETLLGRTAELVELFDTAESVVDETGLPKLMFTLEHREDALDAAFDLEMLLEQTWNPPGEIPTVDALSFADMLVIRYPHEDRFAEIEDLIREYIDVVPPGEAKPIRRNFRPPEGMSAEQVALWIMMNNPDLDIELKDLSPGKAETYGIEILEPPSPDKNQPCVLPQAYHRAVQLLLWGLPGQTPTASESSDDDGSGNDAEPPQDNPPPVEKPEKKSSAEGDAFRKAIAALSRAEEGSGRPTPAQGDGEVKPGGQRDESSATKIKISFDSDKGVFVVEGPAGVVDDVDDWMDELKEEIEKAPVPPDIRIYRVRYLDVYSAADILEEMFNTTKAQRANIQQQQRLAQQRQRQLQQQQQRQRQQQQQQQAKGQQGKGAAARGQQLQQQQQAQVPQIPEAAVRILPNPRDRTLILRADTSQFPAILKLLATVDQPQPINSEFRVYTPKKLNAAEVEELLKETLGLEGSKRGSKKSGGAAAARGASAAAASAAMSAVAAMAVM